MVAIVGGRGVVLALLIVALGGATVASAAARAPRFVLTIDGTQHFDWTLEGEIEGGCTVKSHGVQTLKFRAPATRVIATKNYVTAGPGGYQIVRVGGKTLIPLTGMETREYTVETASAVGCTAKSREFTQNCQGTNPFFPAAGAALVWAGPAVEMHVPTQTLLYERRPKTCDLRLFDLRNAAISQLISYGRRAPLKGGAVYGRGRLLTAAGKLRYCVDPSRSDTFGVSLDECSKIGPAPTRGVAITGSISADWKITLRRSR